MFLKKRKKKSGEHWFLLGELVIFFCRQARYLNLTRYIIYLNNLRNKFISKIPLSLHDDSNNYPRVLLRA